MITEATKELLQAVPETSSGLDRHAAGSAPQLPPQLQPPGGFDLPEGFLLELVLKHLQRRGEARLFDLAEMLALPVSAASRLLAFARREKIAEVARQGVIDGDICYVLTELGQAKARDAMAKCAYVGPAPVPLDAYVEEVKRQSVFAMPVTASRLTAAMGDLVAEPELVERLGAALNSGNAIYLYGPSGSGKTYLAEHMVRTLHGQVWVPHAVYVNGEVIQVFDPVVHKPVASTAGEAPRPERRDARWMLCERPVVMVGGELTLEMLELTWEPHSRQYVASPQMKANNGILVIDDLGRQKVSARELMNRWIVPLDRKVEYLTLHTGAKFQIPFDVVVVFSSNFGPADLADPAFLRRLGYKVYVGAVPEAGYREVIRQACRRARVPYAETAADRLVHYLHARDRVALLPCIPYDIVSKVRDRATYLGLPPALTPELLDWAWAAYFAADVADTPMHIRTLEPAEATP